MIIEITGEVILRIFNKKKEARSGGMYSDDYLALKCNKRETKAKKIMYDFYPIRIYSSNTTTPWLQNIQNGDIVRCEVKVECAKYEDFKVEERSNKYNDYTEISPNLWPRLSLDSYSDTAITVIQSNSKETIIGHNTEVADDFPEPNDDLPF